MLSKAFRSKQLAEELQWWQTLSIMSINNFPLKKFHNCASTEVGDVFVNLHFQLVGIPGCQLLAIGL